MNGKDAASRRDHPSAMPSGEGANLAMFDGAELGKAIAGNSGDIEAALHKYETELFLRSPTAAALVQLMFSENMPYSLVDAFAQDKLGRLDAANERI
ncbi:hypothetical protein [Rhizobium sp. UBA1881]|uniref:hypothetical protein n=1 Tax=Rhizobium sp. UBA1881 TaxID=1947375 RepID=UPI001807B52A|nr:hypothetical protein [Rhizobium sp. UBA1881]